MQQCPLVAKNTAKIAAQEFPAQHENGFFEPIRRLTLAGYSVVAGGLCSLLNPSRTLHDLFLRDAPQEIERRKKHTTDFHDYSKEKYRKISNEIFDDHSPFNYETIFFKEHHGEIITFLKNTAQKDTDKLYNPEESLEDLKGKVDEYYKKSFNPLYNSYVEFLKKVGGNRQKSDPNAQAYRAAEFEALYALKSPHDGIRKIAGMIKEHLNQLLFYQSP